MSLESELSASANEKDSDPTPINAMTVDVEDYFQVSAFESNIQRDDWDGMPLRIHRNVTRILELFDRSKVKATFFVLGWVASREPDLIRLISDSGHEVASHGMDHTRVLNQTPEQFRRDAKQSKELLQEVIGKAVNGYRAASYSIGEKNLWALDVLNELGFAYSSSVYPIKHDLYGMPDAPRFAFRFSDSSILEIPVTTARLFGRNFPCGGGGFFRLFPYALSQWALRRVNQKDGRSGMFYFHPWELDTEQPRVEGISLRTRVRHYLNLHRMEDRLIRLLTDFRWDRMDTVFESEIRKVS